MKSNKIKVGSIKKKAKSWLWMNTLMMCSAVSQNIYYSFNYFHYDIMTKLLSAAELGNI